MRKGLILLVMLLGIAIFQSLGAPAASAHRHWGGWGGHNWGWGHHRWYGGWGGHHNWGFGRGYVYRPYYRPYYRPFYGRSYYRPFVYGGGYSPYGYNSFYPTVNYGYYPSYGYTTGYYDGCQTQTIYQPTYSAPGYETQFQPGGQGIDANALITQVVGALQQQRANNPDGRLLQGRLLDGNGIGNGRLRGVVQNIVGGTVRSQSLDNIVPNSNFVPNNNVAPNNPAAPNIRFSNPDARSKARAYMTQGDTYFREQRYAAAAQQYRAATSMAPDLAEANWRYAHTLVAMGEYDLAVNAVDRALASDSDVLRNGFNLDTLYGRVGTAKASHLESLANLALETESPNAYFLLGMTLHYSGEAARAEKFFARAGDLQDRNASHLVAFLGPAPRVVPEPPALLARVPRDET